MKYIDENNIDQIDYKLWLGNFEGANDNILLEKNKINVIINLYQNKLTRYPNINYYDFPYKFNNISYKESWEIINKLLNIINKHKNDNILINCKAGHHRSANAVVLYLINKYNINYDQAKKYIKNIRKYSLDRESNMTYAMREYGNIVSYIYS